MEFKITGGHSDAQIVLTQEQKDGVIFAHVKMTQPVAKIPARFTVFFKTPCIDYYGTWNPITLPARGISPNFRKSYAESRLASGMPLQQMVSRSGNNRLTIAVSDAATPIRVGFGVCEEDACMDCVVEFFTLPIAACETYEATIRIDLRDIPYYDSLYDVTDWWENAYGYRPAYVPDIAKLPMDSLWYSFHQMLSVDEVLEECRLSHALGMETVLIDDGWQTDDNSRGYDFCGDWEAAPGKVGDFRTLVDGIHSIGMKVIIWFSVPFVGIHSKNWERFQGMMLDQTGNGRTFLSLDPRYREVREFLIQLYVDAVTKWDLDGLKLDFIDSFGLHGKSLEPDGRRDYFSLEDAVDRLMSDVHTALTAIKPDMMIEFRQSYVGPSIRKYGNMMRVEDCPNDALHNRRATVNLRFTSGKTAVHSDMLMWNVNDTAESAAQQLIATLFSVPQISVKIKNLKDDHKKMLAHYLRTWRAYRHVLLDGKLSADDPHCYYSRVCARTEQTEIYAAYEDACICVTRDETLAFNATSKQTLIIKNGKGRRYTVCSCLGDELAHGVVDTDLQEIAVPMAGMIRLTV